MLILSRAVGEVITIGNDIRIHILARKGPQVKIGIEAPENMLIRRDEQMKKPAGSDDASKTSS